METYSLGLYEKAMPNKMSLLDKMTCCAECGFDFMELSIDESDEKLARLQWTAADRLSIVQDMYRAQLPIRSMCLSGHRRYPLGARDPSVRAQGLKIMKQAIQLADDLGIRTIQLAGYDAYYPQDQWDGSKACFLDGLRLSAEMAASKGISMGFETMETPFMNTVWKSMFYVNCVGSPWLGIYPDCGNLTNAAVSDCSSVTEDILSGSGHIIAMHLKATKPGIFRDMLFDDSSSHVDFSSDIAAAWSIGVRRYVTEMWFLGSEHWREDILTASRRMRAILNKLI